MAWLEHLWTTVRALMVLWPVVITLGTVLVGVPLLQRRGLDVSGTRVPVTLLAAQLSTLVLAWATLLAAPDEPNLVETGTCKATETAWVDAVLRSLFVASAVLGGLAWAAASLDERAGWGKVVGYAAVALVTPYVILVGWIWVSLCGYYS
jgi:hypothetical protein